MTESTKWRLRVDLVLYFSLKVLCAEVFAIHLKAEIKFQKIAFFVHDVKKEYNKELLHIFSIRIIPLFLKCVLNPMLKPRMCFFFPP